MIKKINLKAGLSLIEMLVVIAIIAILSAIIYASFEDARKQARDKTRMTALKELQLAVELYKAQNGTYPSSCGGSSDFFGPGEEMGDYYTDCGAEYIQGLVPDFIDSLPQDPKSESDLGMGFYYRSNGSSFKILVQNSVEAVTVSSGDEFYRCPAGCNTQGGENLSNTYAVYSVGAESW